ncbi:hypothetical protein [Nocardioides sp. zg-1228]|uniref:hypothetical protein n=1 Tax=Nocardioides sp. zg-1228 TaxID=2763008 RepID=UPI0016427DA5|nr:hypothetical protein [Nocardioides sp. zg-1228]MBC2934699.1 hypothetical protein [Nocardioides sp. zg-1228]QSF56017.1 hypothetical protein JX575_09950 [Nocardioides sp. zg-1228]
MTETDAEKSGPIPPPPPAQEVETRTPEHVEEVRLSSRCDFEPNDWVEVSVTVQLGDRLISLWPQRALELSEVLHRVAADAISDMNGAAPFFPAGIRFPRYAHRSRQE